MSPLAALHHLAATVTGVPPAIPLPPPAAPTPLPASYWGTEVGRLVATCFTDENDKEQNI